MEARVYNSPLIQELIDEITPEEMEATKQKMLKEIEMEQQSAVEWLIDKFDIILPLDFNWDKLEKVFEQAKQMEKKQIMIAYMKNLPIEDGVITAVQKAENYYNETFKTK